MVTTNFLSMLLLFAPIGGAPPGSGRMDLAAILDDIRTSASGNVLIVDCLGSYGFSSVQAAIDAATDGDTVIVMPRNVFGVLCDGDRYVENIVIADKTITLRSLIPSRPDVVATTVLDGGGGDEIPVLTIRDSASVVSGLTVTGANNRATTGGIRADRSSPMIDRCVITGNHGEAGGGIYSTESNIVIQGCLIYENQSYGGAGISVFRGSAQIIGCTIANNTTISGGTGTGGGLRVTFQATVTLLDSIVWGNTGHRGPQLAVVRESSITVAYSDVEGGRAAVFSELDGELFWDCGNISLDPGFAAPDFGDFHLDLMSLARNAGDPDFVPPFAATDGDGDERIQEGRVDMGYDEFVPPPPSPYTTGDLNQDGVVDLTDLVMLLSNFGR